MDVFDQGIWTEIDGVIENDEKKEIAYKKTSHAHLVLYDINKDIHIYT